MNNYNQNDAQRPQEEEAEIFDNVPEASSEDESAEQIEESELSEIDSRCKQLAEEKVKLEKEKKE